jgi:hypothetical protein
MRPTKVSGTLVVCVPAGFDVQAIAGGVGGAWMVIGAVDSAVCAPSGPLTSARARTV